MCGCEFCSHLPVPVNYIIFFADDATRFSWSFSADFLFFVYLFWLKCSLFSFSVQCAKHMIKSKCLFFFFYLRWIFSLARICWAECVEIGYKCMCLCVCKLNFSRYSSIEFSIQNYKCLHISYMFCVVILCYSLLLPFFTVSSVSRV